jgi:predicted dehydrogenase
MVRDIRRAEALTSKFGAGRAYDSVDELVQDEAVDAVYVSSPVNRHLEHVLKAVDAGKHVFCEKPMAMTRGECQQIISACAGAGVMLGVCFVLRGWPIYQRVRHLMEEGHLGTIVELRSHLAKWTPREQGEWRLDPEQSGGGALIDVATHYLDLFRFLAGEISKVAYMGSSCVFDWLVEETAHTLLEFESGVHGSITASCTIPNGSNVLEVFGSEGSLFLGKTLKIVKGSEVSEEEVVFPDYYSGLLKDFAACAAYGGEPLASGRDGLRGIEVVEAAYRSERESRIVSV